MYLKVQRFINTHKKSFLTFLLLNRLFLAFVFLMLIMTITLRMVTIGPGMWSFKPIFFDLSVIILLGSFGYFVKPKKQYYYFITMISILTTICIINAIYYTFYNTFVTVGLIESFGQVSTVKNAVFDKLKFTHFIFLSFPLIYLLFNRHLRKHNYFNYVLKIENSKKNFNTIMLIGVILFCMNLVTLTKTDISRLVKQWNREYIVERYGIIIYQFNDAIQSVKSSFSSYFGYDEAAKSFKDYYNEREETVSNNKYTNIYKGKNIVFVHMESIMTMFVDLKVNGQEVTPNLNKLTKEGMYFTNFYPQISVGTSSDTEFTLNTSLMPALSGTVFVSYYDRNYLSMEKLLKEKGYYTFSMHGNSATMWNREAMHKSLGYDDFYSKKYYNVTKENTVGLGISDHDFFEQSIPILKKIENEHEKYMGTIITLSNHTPWEDTEKYGDFPLTREVTRVDEKTGETVKITDPYLKDKKMGKYIKSVHYADVALGEFINQIYENDLFNNTVLVFYGDHDSKLPAKEYNYFYNYDPETGLVKTEGDKGYIEYDYYANELNRKTPLIIWTKDKKNAKKITYYTGMIDVLPTIGNMLGIKSKYALGHDIFEIKNNNIISFPNGNFLTENVYYNNSKSEYKVLKDSAVIDEGYITKAKEYTEKQLEISNNIIVYNLIEKEGGNLEK